MKRLGRILTILGLLSPLGIAIYFFSSGALPRYDSSSSELEKAFTALQKTYEKNKELSSDSLLGVQISALNDEDEEVRVAALEAFGGTEDQSALPVATSKSHNDMPSNDDGEAPPEVEQVTKDSRNNRIILALLASFNHEDWSTSRDAMEALIKLGDKDAVPHLINFLNDDKDGESRYRRGREHAAEALGELGDKRAVPHFIDALKGEEDDTEKLGEDVVIDGDSDVVAYSHSVDWFEKEEKQYAARALGKLGDERAVPVLIDALNDDDRTLRAYVAGALGNLGDKRAVPSLISILGDEDSWVRREAALALGELGDERAVDPLINALNDDEGIVRLYALRALGNLKDTRAVPHVVDALRGDNSWRQWIGALRGDENRVRQEAATVLGKIGDREAVSHLLKALKHDVSTVREEAAIALGELGDNEAIPALTEALKDYNRRVRASAAFALGELGDKSGLSVLINTLDDPDELIRLRSELALLKLGGEARVPSYLLNLKDLEDPKRLHAIKKLAKLGDDVAIPALIEATSDEELDTKAKLHIVAALTKLHEKNMAARNEDPE